MDFFNEERAQSEWNSVYMLIVLIIAALLLITVIKPMFQKSQQVQKKIGG
jgi:competence protein ComGC